MSKLHVGDGMYVEGSDVALDIVRKWKKAYADMRDARPAFIMPPPRSGKTPHVVELPFTCPRCICDSSSPFCPQCNSRCKRN